jgi:hypothetical protein
MVFDHRDEYTSQYPDSDEVGQVFRRDVGHVFRFKADHDSDLKSATGG